MKIEKNSGTKFRLLDTEWGVWGLIILAFGLIFFVGYIEHLNSIKECDVLGCNNTCKKGDKYCNEHRHYDLYQQEKINAISRSLRNSDNKKQKSDSSKNSSTTNYYSGDIYGAERYNNPDDFADEWEDDFDSWEDAYDYWEENR
jgi:hypothetical protein